jgi:hypothetical protein
MPRLPLNAALDWIALPEALPAAFSLWKDLTFRLAFSSLRVLC